MKRDALCDASMLCIELDAMRAVLGPASTCPQREATTYTRLSVSSGTREPSRSGGKTHRHSNHAPETAVTSVAD